MTSRGKWIPGSLTSGHYCEVCKREFAVKSSYDKHVGTELHFKRVAQLKSQELSVKSDKYEDKFVDSDRLLLPSRRSGRLNNDIKHYVSNDTTDKTIRCPTCSADVKKRMLGKHLLSYFHVNYVDQIESNGRGRRVDPEKSLILDNIHQIVTQSPYQCKPCKFYFTRPTELLSHFQKYHVESNSLEEKDNVVNRWNCSVCKIRYLTPVGMLDHLRNSSEHCSMEATIQKSIPIIISQVNMQICSYCHEKFLLRRGLLSHKQFCSKRDECLNSDSESLQDILPSEPNVEGAIEYKCSTCFCPCQSLAHLKRHELTHDENRIKNFTCTTCDASFYEKFQLTFHEKIHAGKSAKCTFPGCHYVGRCNSEIKSHAVCHNSTSDLKCDDCSYTTSSKPHWKRHRKLVHGVKDKKFKCDLCSFETSLMSSLRRHELMHTGERPFKCPHNCGYSARNIENLRVHILKRKVHPGAEIYNCQCCIREGSIHVFKTNKFVEFKLHVTKEHANDPNSKSDTGIFIIAGIREQQKEVLEESSHSNTRAVVIPNRKRKSSTTPVEVVPARKERDAILIRSSADNDDVAILPGDARNTGTLGRILENKELQSNESPFVEYFWDYTNSDEPDVNF